MKGPEKAAPKDGKKKAEEQKAIEEADKKRYTFFIHSLPINKYVT